ncbi:hypothetical protein [uncultured Victivallis sp.]|uniref:hypothetical protein n=1 Tax=uncultured Victivallis sp. TaxID=354118 RepID=UPI00258C896E|nr:hypothetical protein [uncultured Victivallis sp.]
MKKRFLYKIEIRRVLNKALTSLRVQKQKRGADIPDLIFALSRRKHEESCKAAGRKANRKGKDGSMPESETA